MTNMMRLPMADTPILSGEDRARLRTRRYLRGIAGVGLLGAAFGFFAARLGQGADALAFAPMTAIALSAMVIAAFALMLFWSRRIMDEHEWTQNVNAAAIGGTLALAAYVPWLLLGKAGLLSAPGAEGMFIISALGGALSYFAMKLRR